MYHFSYFKTEDESMYISSSEDGIIWNNDGEKVLESSVGTNSIRDPFVFKDESGLYHVFGTDGWKSRFIFHATSMDLNHWSEPELISVMSNIKGVCNTWAPECIYDRIQQVYVIFWSSTVKKTFFSSRNNHRIWAVTTKDFKTYSEPFVLFDPGYNVIDASMIYFKGQLLMAFKDERGMSNKNTTHKGIQIASAKSPLGPFSIITEIISPNLVEGPTLYEIGGELIMLFDCFMDERYGAMKSHDGITWMIDDSIKMPKGSRHGSVFK